MRSFSAKSSFLIVFGLLIITGILYTVYRDRLSDTQNFTQSSAQDQSTESSSSAATLASSGGKYLDYSDAAVTDAEGQRVLFFHASWCFQCRQLEEDIQSNGVPTGYTILKVDYDSNQSLRQKYGVTRQTTLVKIDAAGNPVDTSYVSYDDPTITTVAREYLR